MKTRHPDRSRLQPQHCPSQECRHHNDLHGSWRYKRNELYLRRFDAGRIRRFICHSCGVSFSSRSFKPDDDLKRLDMLSKLVPLSVGARAVGQVAGHLGVSPSTIDCQFLRQGSHCLAWAKVRTSALGVNRRHGVVATI